MAGQFSITQGKPWKTRFFIIWGGQACSLLGSQLVQFALIWYLTIQTGSATVLAKASMLGILPAVVLGPFIGTLTDRWNRKLVLLAADGVVTISAITLTLLFSLGIAQIQHIYVVIFIRSFAGSFHMNALNASTSLMVPMERLTRIQGLNQMLNGSVNVLAAPLGAALLGMFPIQGVLLVDIITAIIAMTPLVFIPIPQPERRKQTQCSTNDQDGSILQPKGVIQEMLAGFRYIRSWPGLLMIGVMMIGINFTVIPAFSLLPLLIKDYFGGDAMQLGWTQSAMGIGVFGGGALLGIWGGFKNKMHTSLLALMGMGAGILILALAPPQAILLVIGGTFVLGFMESLTMGPFVAVVQSSVDPAMQARVFSLLSSVGTAMVPLGLMLAGPVSEHFGLRIWFLIGGIACLSMGMIGFFVPSILNLESQCPVPVKNASAL